MRLATLLRSSALAALLGLLFIPTAQAQLGIAAGLNFDDIGDIDAGDREATFDNATGYHIGVFYDLAVGPLAVRPGLFYRDLGEVDASVEGLVGVAQDFDVTLIEVPLDLRVRLAALPLIRPYALAGPVLSFASSDNESFDEALEDISVAANVGVGVEISLPIGGLTLYPELRYAFGISRFVDEEALTIGNATFTANDGSRLNTFMLRLGVGF